MCCSWQIGFEASAPLEEEGSCIPSKISRAPAAHHRPLPGYLAHMAAQEEKVAGGEDDDDGELVKGGEGEEEDAEDEEERGGGGR